MDNNDSPSSSWIPEGYIEVIGPNGQQYLVPRFYAPALNNSLEGSEEKKQMDIEKAAGTVSFFKTSSAGQRLSYLTITLRFENFIALSLVSLERR
jgi:hypothetical protein